jgi:hypothetical protein
MTSLVKYCIRRSLLVCSKPQLQPFRAQPTSAIVLDVAAIAVPQVQNEWMQVSFVEVMLSSQLGSSASQAQEGRQAHGHRQWRRLERARASVGQPVLAVRGAPRARPRADDAAHRVGCALVPFVTARVVL